MQNLHWWKVLRLLTVSMQVLGQWRSLIKTSDTSQNHGNGMCTNKTKVCVCVSCHIPVTRIMFVGTSAHPTNMGRNMNKRIRRSRKVLSFWNVNVKMAARQEFRGEDSFDRNIKTSILFLRPWSCTHTQPLTQSLIWPVKLARGL